ncbi:fructosamine kinase family protein [Nodosilinea sp. E11]|uniref:fructosamine kinase family protein n=1 Tax=Nodosilinea sp. E11 TaxID=3037479 RepID=UPI0029340FF7|nr:fructosamine kinase family protein [Nodosilinea sp. E11]WOD37714.1 fructosamine kinase family protein [Nodosilinea sp. E11]
MWTAIAQHISAKTGQAFTIQERRSVSGGCINQAYQINDGAQAFFIKLNQASQVAMFEAEALGLSEMYDSQTIRVPKPLCWGTVDGSAYIVMEWLDLGGSGEAWGPMGSALAAMHRVTSDQGFGWRQTNTIGATPQPNPWTETWLEFYREQRLRHQFRLAGRRGGRFPRQHELLMALPDLLASHHPAPALVHGDLWSGNAAVTAEGEPVILDPATYYGDREVDLAMTELFGRFPEAFYRAYNAAYPLEGGYATRKILYNLYHVINHFNLFGGSYEAQANRMIDQLLR